MHNGAIAARKLLNQKGRVIAFGGTREKQLIHEGGVTRLCSRVKGGSLAQYAQAQVLIHAPKGRHKDREHAKELGLNPMAVEAFV